MTMHESNEPDKPNEPQKTSKPDKPNELGEAWPSQITRLSDKCQHCSYVILCKGFLLAA